MGFNLRFNMFSFEDGQFFYFIQRSEIKDEENMMEKAKIHKYKASTHNDELLFHKHKFEENEKEDYFRNIYEEEYLMGYFGTRREKFIWPETIIGISDSRKFTVINSS